MRSYLSGRDFSPNLRDSDRKAFGTTSYDHRRRADPPVCRVCPDAGGDEKGEAQVFCDRLFQAFGHGGYKEAGATLEYRVKGQGKSTKFADLLWRPRLLIEMKKRGEKLQRHYTQAFEYWLQLVPHRPKYVVLCNFDEFWIYDFDLQLNDPVDIVGRIRGYSWVE